MLKFVSHIYEKAEQEVVCGRDKYSDCRMIDPGNFVNCFKQFHQKHLHPVDSFCMLLSFLPTNHLFIALPRPGPPSTDAVNTLKIIVCASRPSKRGCRGEVSGYWTVNKALSTQYADNQQFFYCAVRTLSTSLAKYSCKSEEPFAMRSVRPFKSQLLTIYDAIQFDFSPSFIKDRQTSLSWEIFILPQMRFIF